MTKIQQATTKTIQAKETKTEAPLCPKCGSKMIERKIWKKFTATHVNQCVMCKFYIKIEKKEVVEDDIE